MDLRIMIQKDLAAQKNKLVRLYDLNSPQILKEKQLEMIERLDILQKSQK